MMKYRQLTKNRRAGLRDLEGVLNGTSGESEEFLKDPDLSRFKCSLKRFQGCPRRLKWTLSGSLRFERFLEELLQVFQKSLKRFLEVQMCLESTSNSKADLNQIFHQRKK